MLGNISSRMNRFHAIAVWSMMLAAGCDSDESAPPPPPSIGVTASTDSPLLMPPPVQGGVKEIDLVLPGKIDPPMVLWEQGARRESTKAGNVFELRRAPEGSGPEEQGRQVMEAIRGGADAVLIAPTAEGIGDVGPIVAEAKRMGTQLVSFLVPIKAGDEEVPVIVREDYGPKAREVVRALVEDAELVGLKKEGPALMLMNDLGTEHLARAQAMTEALREAGISLLGGEPKHFTNDYEVAKEIVTKAMQENPKLSYVVVVEDVGFRAALSVRGVTPGADRYVMGGFVENAGLLDMVKRSHASAVAQCGQGAIGRLGAARVAEALSRGEALPSRIVIPMAFERAPDPPSQDAMEMDLPSGEAFRKQQPGQ